MIPLRGGVIDGATDCRPRGRVFDYGQFHFHVGLIAVFVTDLRPTQPFIPPGSVNEYQLRLERLRQVWFIPLLDVRGVCR